jgi:hypothetical protein
VAASPERNQKDYFLQRQQAKFNKEDQSGSSVQIHMSIPVKDEQPSFHRNVVQPTYTPPSGFISQKSLNAVNIQQDWAPTDPGKLVVKEKTLREIRNDVAQRSFETKQRYKISSFQKYKKPLIDIGTY